MKPMEPQPGTIPHRAVTWLRAMDKVQPGCEHSTIEICDAIDVDVAGFAACLRPLRERGLLHTRKHTSLGHKVLLWRLGDGTYDANLIQREVLVFDAHLDRSQQGKRNDQQPAEPAAPALPPSLAFRATVFEGKLLATGMEIVDGVAVFTQEQVLQLKRHTDWWATA